MSLDKFQQAWNAEASRERVAFDSDSLSKEVERSHVAFRSTVFWRDVREVGMSLVMIPIWFVLGNLIPVPWTWWLTVPVMLWVAGFMLWDRKRHPQHLSEPGGSLLFCANESLAQVEHQIWLLRNVFWWCLLPPSISIMTFFVHVAWISSDGWPEFILFAGFLGLFLFIVYGATYRLNQRSVRDQLEPRRQKLQQLISNLEDDHSGEPSGEMMELVSDLSSCDGNAGMSPNWATWSENWNRIIPSWREVVIILVPTLAGAFCGLWYPVTEQVPVFFQSVVAAVIPFEIAFFSLWYLASRRHKGQPLTGKGISRPGGPAIMTICMIVVISALAFAALYVFIAHAQSARGPGLDDISAFTADDVVNTDEWLQGIRESFYPSLGAVVVRDGEIVYRSNLGFENLDSRKPASSATPYHVASVT